MNPHGLPGGSLRKQSAPASIPGMESDFRLMSHLELMPSVVPPATPELEPGHMSAAAAALSTVEAEQQTAFADIPNHLKNMKEIKKTLNYYFSVENLRKDKYLNEQMDADRYVSIAKISKFRKMEDLLQNLQEDERIVFISNILHEIPCVEIDPTGTKVRSVNAVFYEPDRVINSEEYYFILIRNMKKGLTTMDVEAALSNALPFRCKECFPASSESFYVIFETREESKLAHEVITKGICLFGGIPATATLKSSRIKPMARFEVMESRASSSAPVFGSVHPPARAFLEPPCDESPLRMAFASLAMAPVGPVPAPAGSLTHFPTVLNGMGQPVALSMSPVYITPKVGGYQGMVPQYGALTAMYAPLYRWDASEQGLYGAYNYGYAPSFYQPQQAIPVSPWPYYTEPRRGAGRNIPRSSRPHNPRLSEMPPLVNQTSTETFKEAGRDGAVVGSSLAATQNVYGANRMEPIPHDRQQNWKNSLPKSGRSRRGRYPYVGSGRGARGISNQVVEPQFDCSSFPPLQSEVQETFSKDEKSLNSNQRVSSSNKSPTISSAVADGMIISADSSFPEHRLSYAQIASRKDTEDSAVDANLPVSFNGTGSTSSSVVDETLSTREVVTVRQARDEAPRHLRSCWNN